MTTPLTTDTPPRRSRRSLPLAGMLAGLLLLLTGCFQGSVAFDVGTDGNTTLTMEGYDTTGMATRDEVNCQDFNEGFNAGGGNSGTVDTIEEREQDGNIGCYIVVTGPTAEMTNEDGSQMVWQEGDEVTFNFGGLGPMDEAGGIPGMAQPELTMSVTFPGDVIDGGGGEVDGNTVTYAGTQYAENGFTAVGSASGGLSIPMWVWFAVGGVIILIVAVILIFALRGNKKNAATQGGYAQGGYPQGGYPQGPYQQGGQQQWGQGQPGWDQGQQQWGQGQQGWPQGGQQQWGQGQPGWDQGQQQWGQGQPGWDQGQQQWGQGQQGWDQQGR